MLCLTLTCCWVLQLQGIRQCRNICIFNPEVITVEIACFSNPSHKYIYESQWAEVLSADAFSAFEDAGLDSREVCDKACDVFEILARPFHPQACTRSCGFVSSC